MVSISVTVMCVIRLAVNSHMVIKAYIVVSVQFLWCVQYSIHCREEPFEPTMIFFSGILTFFGVDAAAVYNLKKMAINSVFILCTDVSHFC